MRMYIDVPNLGGVAHLRIDQATFFIFPKGTNPLAGTGNLMLVFKFFFI